MKVSEFIKALENIMAWYGDREVCIEAFDAVFDVGEFNVYKKNTLIYLVYELDEEE